MATAVRKPFPPIPYGMADFRAIREEGYLYVDKTRFVREMENDRHVFLLRPRRFGKSCWVSILQHYYDRTREGNFEALFAGTDIGAEPTTNRSRYAVLRLNFSTFSKELSTLQENFEGHCDTHLRGMLRRNADLFPAESAQRILSPPTMGRRLDELFLHAEHLDARLCVLIDEYDNFANTILAGDGLATYHAITHGGGWFRGFFATLKAGTESGNLERLFITGVSPVTMDDVTSGFNIGTNISFDPAYNQIAGFTEAEVRSLVEMYRKLGVFDEEPDAATAVMREWYNGYRFAKDAAEDMYNTNMVLYYLKHCVPNKQGPEHLVDTNVRIDYGKLRHLVLVNRDAALAAERAADADPAASGGALAADEPSAGEREGCAPRTKKLAKGYADMVLTPLTVQYPTLRPGFVIELKYLKRGDDSEASAQSALDTAKEQLRGYLRDERLARRHPTVRFAGIALVFRGWELVGAEEVRA